MSGHVEEPVAVRDVQTPVGLARVHLTGPAAGSPTRTTVVLGHGAGGGVGARDLVALAAQLPAAGHRVVLVEQPWRVAGRRVAGPPTQLDRAWGAVLAELSGEGLLAGRLVSGGRSAGARVACRTADDVGASAVLALAFPLHPPGRPERSRAEELQAVAVPTLVVQGERDAFGRPAEVEAAVRGSQVEVVVVPGGDHGFAVPAAQPGGVAEAMAGLVAQVMRWLDRLDG